MTVPPGPPAPLNEGVDGIEVRGSASAEELAAVLAALSCTTADGSPPAGYERWRQRRIALLRGELAR